MSLAPRSLGLKTELFIFAKEGTVTPHGGCLVLRTPDNPGYWYAHHAGRS